MFNNSSAIAAHFRLSSPAGARLLGRGPVGAEVRTPAPAPGARLRSDQKGATAPPLGFG